LPIHHIHRASDILIHDINIGFVSVILSVRPSVCLSVQCRYYVATMLYIVKLFTPSGRDIVYTNFWGSNSPKALKSPFILKMV